MYSATMVTTRSQTRNNRLHVTQNKKTKCFSNNTVSSGPVTRSQTLSTRTLKKCEASNIYKRDNKTPSLSPYATRSKRMNTRSNTKRFLELTTKEGSQPMTRSMTKFVKKYSDYTGMKTRSMTLCM